jgi:phage-related protein
MVQYRAPRLVHGAVVTAGQQKPRKAIQAVFYRTARDNEPVREFLDGLTAADRKNIGGDIAQVEWKWPKVTKPLVDSFGKGLYEVRSSLRDRIARIYFGVEQAQMILLHGVIKKTQKADKADIELARERLKDWKSNVP